jgi:signal transduction histidine kinase
MRKSSGLKLDVRAVFDGTPIAHLPVPRAVSMVVLDVSILWVFLASALVVLMQAQALRLAKTNRELAGSEHALRVRNAELDNVNSRLSEVDVLKSRFLAGITQEIRRPLDTLLSEVGILRRHHGQDPTLIEKVSAAIVDEGAQLARLIESLSERASNEKFKFEWTETQVDPSAMLEEAVGTLQSVAVRRKIEIRCTAPSEISPVWAHHDRFVHALVLMLDSAVTYTPENGIVEADVLRAGPEVIFQITQKHGAALTQDRIDDILSCSTNSASLDDGGMHAGFTLRLCRDIVANHHGRFWIDSTPTLGTVFYVALPAVQYERRAATYTGESAGAA